jgi:hypothetical protein
MDETKIELPAWLPWATTACLAALVACLCELWIIERTRTQILKDENLMADATLKSTQNQLEAEKIENARVIEELKSVAGPQGPGEAALLIAPGADPADPLPSGQPWGAAGWNFATQTGCFRFVDLPALGADRDYQLWIDASGDEYPKGVVIEGTRGDDWAVITIRPAKQLPTVHRFLVVNTAKGGARTLKEALAGGSIILASLPLSPKISNP